MMGTETQTLAATPQKRGVMFYYSYLLHLLGIYYPILRRAIIGA